MLKGLVFDCDGVLADTEPVIAEASIEMFRELYEVELTPEDFRPFIGTGAVRYVEGPAEKLGITLDLEAALKRRTENFARILRASADIALPGVKALIEAAAASPEWALAIATSSPQDKFEVTFEAAGLRREAFTAIITGDMVTHKKPHPEIYEAAGQALDIPAGRCVVVEDAMSGVASAKAAGMLCLAVTNSFSADDLAGADRIVGSLEEVDLALLSALVAQADG